MHSANQPTDRETKAVRPAPEPPRQGAEGWVRPGQGMEDVRVRAFPDCLESFLLRRVGAAVRPG